MSSSMRMEAVLHRRGATPGQEASASLPRYNDKPSSSSSSSKKYPGSHNNLNNNHNMSSFQRHHKITLIALLAVTMLMAFWGLNFLVLPHLLPASTGMGAVPISYPLFVRMEEDGNIFFVQSETEHFYVNSCHPCDNPYTVCPDTHTQPEYIIPVLSNRQIPAPLHRALAEDTSGKLFVCPLHPLGFEGGPALRWLQASIADSHRIGQKDKEGVEIFEGFVKDLVYQSGAIYFVSNGVKHPVMSCMPCGRRYTLCPEANDLQSPASLENVVGVTLLYERNEAFRRTPEGPAFQCRQYPLMFEGYSSWRRKPLNIQVSAAEPKRLNIVMTGIGRDLTGGPLSIMRFASAMLDKQRELLLGKQEFGIRWINIDGQGINGKELAEHLEKYDSLSTFRQELIFVHDALNPRTDAITVNPGDVFMSTLYFTSFICHETAKHPQLHNKNFLYFIQDFEPIFFPQDANFLEAMESYRYPHFAIYSTWFLHNWFKERKYGQYQFLSQGAADAVAYASEPAIKPWGTFDTTVFDDPHRTRKVIVYARSHADRNAYQLTIDTLSRAVCEGLITTPEWEVIGVGATEDYVEYLGQQCGKKLVMKIYANIPEPEYRKIVRSGDVGLSLMVSPHPSLPPFDFVSAGLVTVTNTFETKSRESFERVSKLFVVSEPYPIDLVFALQEAIKLSEDITFRKNESEKMNWESEWDGERCYGKGLYNILERWFRTQKPLWDVSQIDYSVHARNNGHSQAAVSVM